MVAAASELRKIVNSLRSPELFLLEGLPVAGLSFWHRDPSRHARQLPDGRQTKKLRIWVDNFTFARHPLAIRGSANGGRNGYGRALTITRVRSSDWAPALNSCTLAKIASTISFTGRWRHACNS